MLAQANQQVMRGTYHIHGQLTADRKQLLDGLDENLQRFLFLDRRVLRVLESWRCALLLQVRTQTQPQPQPQAQAQAQCAASAPVPRRFTPADDRITPNDTARDREPTDREKPGSNLALFLPAFAFSCEFFWICIAIIGRSITSVLFVIVTLVFADILTLAGLLARFWGFWAVSGNVSDLPTVVALLVIITSVVRAASGRRPGTELPVVN